MRNTSILVSMLLLVVAIFGAFNVRSVGALPFTVYIRADGSIDPPSANITTSDNITYTFTDHNYCGLQVERDNIVIDGAGYVLHGIIEGSIMNPSENDTLVGLNLTGRNNVTVQNLNVNYVPTGINLSGAVNCTIRRNTINVDGPFMGATCIRMFGCANITVVENTIRDSYRGIDLYSASENQIVRNNFINDLLAISLSDSSSNVVAENSFVWTAFALIIYDISNDRFYHNNFYYRHRDMARLDAVWTQVHWNESYTVGGNYWSDYAGDDLYSGPYQNETGPDGIGDTAHLFADGAAEMYPLMSPWTTAVMWRLAGDINSDFTVDIYDALVLANVYGIGSTNPNWNPNADLNGDLTVDIFDAIILAGNYGSTVL